MALKKEPAVSERYLRGLLGTGNPPETPRMLNDFLRMVLRVNIPTEPLLEGSAAPFEYIVHAFYEGSVSAREPGLRSRVEERVNGPSDAVVWAARGAGKTYLGAVATTLDLLFKPGIEVRILGGSLEQSQRMHEHLRRIFELPLLAPYLAERITERRVALSNGSRAQILAQSQTSVRGARVQKLRCDEVELFDPQVWHAAQLTTRSMKLPGPWGDVVRGSVEALSTMHRPHGLMWNLVADAGEGGKGGKEGGGDGGGGEAGSTPRRAVFRWGLVDALARCGPRHECGTCSLQPECGGRAKRRDATPRAMPGHIGVNDAKRMKSRVALAVWESEMLCLRPRRSDCVFPEFEHGAHVGDWGVPSEAGAGVAPSELERVAAFDAPVRANTPGIRWVAGMDFGIRAPTVMLLAWYRPGDPERVLHVEAEHVKADWTVERHARVLLEGNDEGWPRPAPSIDWVGVDPAGHQRSEQTGVSSINVLRKAGFNVRSRRLPLHQGLDLVRARLRPAAAGGSDPGAGPTARLFIHRRCTKLIESLSRYHFPEERPESLEPVKDGSDHAVDALRYLVVCLDRPHEAKLSAY